MKKTSFICLFSIILLISTSTYALNSKCIANEPGCVTPKTTEVKIGLNALPCGRDTEKPCISIFIRPSAVIELYKMDVGKLDTFDFPNESIPEGQNAFTISLFPGRYFFYVFNKNNKQRTTFGPVEIFPDVKKMSLEITMYNSMEIKGSFTQNREMCFSQTVEEYHDKAAIPPLTFGKEMQCNYSFNDLPRVIKPIE